MILAISLIFGPIIGWRRGASRSVLVRFAGVWLAAWVVQTAVLLSATDSVRDRGSGQLDAGYLPICAAIFAAGVLLTHVSGTLGGRRVRPPVR